MDIKKAVLAFEPFYTNGESPPLGAAIAATLLKKSGLFVVPMDFCWYTRTKEPGLFKLIKQYTGIWRNNNRVNFVNNIELLLYLLYPDAFANFRNSLDLGLNPEAREYDLLSLGLERDSIVKANKIISQTPDVIFFSVYISNLIPTLMTVKKCCEKVPHIPVILAGPGTVNPITVKLIKVLFPKGVYFQSDLIKHEKSDLIKKSKYNSQLMLPPKTLEAIKILCSPSLLSEHINKTKTIIDFSGFPWPQKSLKSYLKDFIYPEKNEFMGGVTGYLPVLPATGCLMKCAFCSESAIWGKIHSINPTLVVQNMVNIKKNHILPGMVLMMNSSLLNFNTIWLKKFCENIESSFGNDPIKWWCYMRPDSLLTDPDIAVMLYKAGLRWVSLGFESGSSNMLKKMGKGTNPQIFMDILENLSSTGISCAATLLTGFPGETEQDFKDTLNLLESWYEGVQYHIDDSCNDKPGIDESLIDSPLRAPVFFDAGGMIRLEPDSILYKDRSSYGISLEKRPYELPDLLKRIPGLEKILDLVCLNWQSDVSWDIKMKRQRILINRACYYGQAQKGRAW